MTADLTAAREAAIEAGASHLCEIDDRSDFWSCITHGTEVYVAGVHSCSTGIEEAEITYDAMYPLIAAAVRAQVAAEIAEEATVAHLEGSATDGETAAFTMGVKYAAWSILDRIARGGGQ